MCSYRRAGKNRYDEVTGVETGQGDTLSLMREVERPC